eukprot:1152019-Pelagomonas_calceolata.AAC.4
MQLSCLFLGPLGNSAPPCCPSPTRGGVSILKAWCGLPPAPPGPIPRQGGAPNYIEHSAPRII